MFKRNCWSVLRPYLLVAGLSVGAVSSANAQVAIPTCNGATLDFDNIFGLNIDDAVGMGVLWRQCSEAENLTGQAGKSICVTPNGVPFDTTMQFASVNLQGALSAEMRFTIYYEDALLFNDRIEVEARDNVGPWTPLFVEQFNDIGLPGGPGVQLNLNLLPFLGSENVDIRFRYRDISASGIGSQVQIDSFSLKCTGGADIETTLSSDTAIVNEGDLVNFQFAVTNNGSQNATDPVSFVFFPASFSLLDVQNTPFGSMEQQLSDLYAFGPPVPIPNGDTIPIELEVRAGLVPEVTFEVTSPAFLAGSYPAGGALFGPQFDATNPTTGNIVLAVDNAGGNFFDGCDPLVNAAAISGNIALLHNVLCDADVAVKNAQDAGAKAVIVGSGSSLEYDLIYPNLEVGPLKPSGALFEAIAMPVLRVNNETADALKTNIASGISVEIFGIDVLAQEHRVLGYSLAEEFDPGFNLFFLFFGEFEDTNNFSTQTVTVLRDRDSDGTADINEECPSDPTKTSAGVCGCGVSDADGNGDGMIDCLQADVSPASVTISTDELLKAVQRLKGFSSSLSSSKKKLAKKRRKEAKQALETLDIEVATNGGLVVLASGSPSLDILMNRIRVSVKKALRIASPSFSQKKKQAKRRVNRLKKVLL